MIKIIAYFFNIFIMLGFLGAAALVGFVSYLMHDLPNYELLSVYEPPVTTRVHAADGSLIEEFAYQHRLYLPIETIPNRLKEAFLSAEDKNFYDHPGVDLQGLMRAVFVNLRNLGSGRRPVGASTITQQVAKNFLLSSDQTFERKIKEFLLSFKIEKTYSKDRILELYMNEIFFGLGAYGVASASLAYFDKPAHLLTIAEAAYLAALPKGPANYHPFKHTRRAIVRRNNIIDLMVENEYITKEEAEKAKAEPLNVVLKKNAQKLSLGQYFTEEVRKEIILRYGEKQLYEGGLSVRTTLDPQIQIAAEKVMRNAMLRYDKKKGYRGVKGHINIAQSNHWKKTLSNLVFSDDVPEWYIAVVLSVTDSKLSLAIKPKGQTTGKVQIEPIYGEVKLSDSKWVTNSFINQKRVFHNSFSSLFRAGDIIYVEKKEEEPINYLIRQVPLVSGGMVAMDPYTGRVLAMVGGFSYSLSKFNRATQAMRQPGSAFKPIVYAAALDNGYTPASVIMDAPITIQIGEDVWIPKNYDGSYTGPLTLRSGIERSRNLMTVRLAHDMGMNIIAEYAQNFGIYKKLAPHIAMSLGAGETTVMRMVSAYAVMANGGLSIVPSLIDRIQDRYGNTLFRYDQRLCPQCLVSQWEKQPEPVLIEKKEQVLDPMTAYQITSMMMGVVQRGTAMGLKHLNYPIAGKTGTTSSEKDAWFIGYTSNLVVGLYLGFDKPSSLGEKVTGSSLAVPVVKEFMQKVLPYRKPLDFSIPAGMQVFSINRKTGMPSPDGDPDTIFEYFKPGTGPADSYAVIGTDVDNIKESEMREEMNEDIGGLY